MAHIVKCKKCGKQFDRDKIECVKEGNRYSHVDCNAKTQPPNQDLRKLTDLIVQLYKPHKPDWPLVMTQIQRYFKEGKTYLGMYYTLTYFFIIKGNDIHKGKGVGIIPYAYDKARAYYQNMDNIYAKAAEVEHRDDIKVSQDANIVILTQHKPKKKLLDFNY